MKHPERKLACDLQKLYGWDFGRCLRAARKALAEDPEADISTYLAARTAKAEKLELEGLKQRRAERDELRAARLNGWVM